MHFFSAFPQALLTLYKTPILPQTLSSHYFFSKNYSILDREVQTLSYNLRVGSTLNNTPLSSQIFYILYTPPRTTTKSASVMATLLYRSCVLLGCLISVTTAAPEPKVVRMQTSRVQPRSTILKRAPLSVTIGNEPLIGLYYVNASVGSPPQTVQLQIDTGSSDVWMFGPQSCNTSTSQCLGGTCELHYSYTYC